MRCRRCGRKLAGITAFPRLQVCDNEVCERYTVVIFDMEA